MDKKIYSLIKALEQQYGSPVQISVERPKETEQVLERDYRKVFFPTIKNIYGSLEERACEVLPLPTDVHEVKHDLDLIVGEYDSLRQLNSKLKGIKQLHLLCLRGCYFDEGLRNHLATKYEVKEKIVGIAHGGEADWYSVDGTEADLGEWGRKRPDLYKESLHYLENNTIPFWYHDLVATPHGVYINKREFHGVDGDVLEHYFGTNNLEALHLTQKIADIKLDLLK